MNGEEVKQIVGNAGVRREAIVFPEKGNTIPRCAWPPT